MEIRLDLSRHCIETAARLKLERLIRQCLKTPDQDTETMIEALTCFLSHNDFGYLRRRIDAEHKNWDSESLQQAGGADFHVSILLPQGAPVPFLKFNLGRCFCILSLPPDVSFP